MVEEAQEPVAAGAAYLYNARNQHAIQVLALPKILTGTAVETGAALWTGFAIVMDQPRTVAFE